MFIPKGGITLYTFESSNVNNLQQVGKDQSRHKVIFSGEIQELCGVRYQDKLPTYIHNLHANGHLGMIYIYLFSNKNYCKSILIVYL